jgi:hypothetical protein
MMTGLIVRALAQPAIAETMRLAAFGSSREATWTFVSHNLVGVLLSHLEPDPSVRWDGARIRDVLRAVEDFLASVDSSVEPADGRPPHTTRSSSTGPAGPR